MLDLVVTEVQHYTDKLFRIITQRPSSYRFTAGEFVMIKLEGTPERAYSLTSGPYDDYLEFYSIKVQDGPLTSKLQHIKEGDMLKVGVKPTGTLILANLELGGDLWLLASGTGIAPFISLLRDPQTFELFDNIHVTWTVRQAVELEAYKDFLYSLPIKFFPTVTQEHYENQGRIQKFLNHGVLTVDNPDKQRIMICGSMSFNNDLKERFNKLGFNEGNKKTQGTFVQEKAFVG